MGVKGIIARFFAPGAKKPNWPQGGSLEPFQFGFCAFSAKTSAQRKNQVTTGPAND